MSKEVAAAILTRIELEGAEKRPDEKLIGETYKKYFGRMPGYEMSVLQRLGDEAAEKG